VELFARALAFNREQGKLDQAEAVNLGIAAAFNPEAELIQEGRQALLNPEKESEPAELKPEVMASLFGGVPLAEK